MTRNGLAVLVLLTGGVIRAQNASAPLAPASEGKLVQEVWYSAFIDERRAGFLHFTVHELESSGLKVHRAAKHLHLTLKRFGDFASIETTTGTDESGDGKVLGVFMRQGLGKQTTLQTRGVVQGNTMRVNAVGKMEFDNKLIPWNPEALGNLGEMQHVAKLKPQPGQSFKYVFYEPIINSQVTINAKAEAIEPVVVAGQKPLLLRIIQQPQPLAEIALPASTCWYDAKYELVKSETIMPGLGRLVLERSTREDSLQPCTNPPDLGLRQAIRLKQRLASGHDCVQAVYRIQIKDAKAPTVFASDNRQSVKEIGPNVIELTVRAVKEPPTASQNAAQPDAKFLASNYFITSDDPLVRQHAANAVGTETDPWKKAQRVERWVKTNMKVLNFTEAMAPASAVAKSLSGDCTEYSMLCAAMCRAAGVPSRTALGLVYVDAGQGRPPMFAMHMWTEVWVAGQWVGLDPTLGRGSIGAAHIKVADHDWQGVATMTPILPLMRFIMAEPVLEIVQEQRTQP